MSTKFESPTWFNPHNNSKLWSVQISKVQLLQSSNVQLGLIHTEIKNYGLNFSVTEKMAVKLSDPLISVWVNEFFVGQLTERRK